jgi:hypothetical protein
MASTHDRDPRPGRRPSPGFDPTNIDLTDFDVVRAIRGTVGIGGSLAARATELAKDATYVTVGLGLLGYQRAQVRRREFERSRRR